MATIKTAGEFFKPDPASEMFSGLTPENRCEIVQQYCRLNNGVPEDVRSYYSAVANLWTYGWLCYPFHTLAAFLTNVVVEMALRERLPARKLNKKGRDLRSLRDLLLEAKEAGLLSDDGFPSRRGVADDGFPSGEGFPYESAIPDQSVSSSVPYTDVLVGILPLLRNNFAHPKMHAIILPGHAFDSLTVTAEIINQLWPEKRQG